MWAESISRTYEARVTRDAWVPIPAAQLPPDLLRFCENRAYLGTKLAKDKKTGINYTETCWGSDPIVGFVVFSQPPPSNWVPYDAKVRWVMDRIAIWD
jgi:hypothetical protein